MTPWLVPRADDPNSMAVIETNFKPQDAIIECPTDPLTNLPEEAAWLTIQEINDPATNELRKVAVVDQSLKTQMLSDRQAASQAVQDARAERLVEVRRLFERADNFDKKQLVTIEELQDAISDIVQVLRFITENDRPQGE